jgi:hypothetical protein
MEADDSEVLRKIIETNTCIWGGRFNAIIPVYRRTPKWWSDRPLLRLKAKDIVRGYLEAFEPDYIVATQPELAAGIDFESKHVLKLEDIISADRDEGVAHGISVIDLYRDLYRREFQFVRRQPRTAVCPSISEQRLSLFAATCFGTFPSTAQVSYFDRAYRDAFEATDVAVTGDNLFETLAINVITPLRSGSVGLQVNPRSRLEPALFYMDATKVRDLVDYWNLRAIGWRILPVPKQWAGNLVEPCKEFVRANYLPYPYNPQMMRSTKLIPSRSVQWDEVRAFGGRIQVAGDPLPSIQPLSIQHWYPRLWDEWARDKDDAERCNIIAEEARLKHALQDDGIEFRSLSPGFATGFGGSGEPRWANVLQLRDYRLGSETAVDFPPGLKDLDRLLGTFEYRVTSVNSEGIVVRCKHANWTHRMRLPTGFTVFRSWLGSRGYSADLSGAGRIAMQLIRALGGPWGAHAIKHLEIIKLLDDMAHGLIEVPAEEADSYLGKPRARGRIVSRKTLWALLQRINGTVDRAQRHFEALTQRGILRIGLQLKCPECAQTNWYPPGRIEDRIVCERCLRESPFPAAHPPADSWGYRSQGAFSVENYAQGGYTVALALRFLTTVLHAEATWVPSLVIKDAAGTEYEIDFGAWWRRSAFETTPPTLIWGECKSLRDQFESKDVARARVLAKQFPGTFLVFATLRDELNLLEKARLSRLARAGRKYFRAERWLSPVLILTGRELMSDEEPPHCWEGLGGKFDTVGRQDSWLRQGLIGLCDATQQLHLDMESYAQWQQHEIKKRQLRGKAAASKLDSGSE